MSPDNLIQLISMDIAWKKKKKIKTRQWISMILTNDQHKWSPGPQPFGLRGGTPVRESDIHKCTFSGCDKPRHTTFLVQPPRELHSFPSWSLWAASWSGPSWSSWWACCLRLHTGLPSLYLPHQSRSPWNPEHSSLHSPSVRCFHLGLVVWPGFLLVQCSIHLLHGSVWVPQW